MDRSHRSQRVMKPAAAQIRMELLVSTQIMLQRLVQEQCALSSDVMPALMVLKAEQCLACHIQPHQHNRQL